MPIKNVIISDDITVSGRKLRFQTSNTIQFDFDSETDAYIGGGEAPIAFVGEPTTDELRNIVSDGYLPKRVAKEDVTIELYDTEGNKFYETSTVVSYYVETKDFTSQQFIGDQPKEEVQQFDPAIAGEIPETDGINYQLGIVPPSLPEEPFIPQSFASFLSVTGSDQISGSSSPITGTSAFTVEVRFKTAMDNSFKREAILGWGDSTVNGGKAHIRLNNGSPTNALRFEWQNGNLIGTRELNDNRWHMASVTKPAGDDGTLTKLYVDGVEISASGVTGQQIDIVDTDPLQVAGVFQSGVGNQDFTGFIDEVRIWDTVRTAEEVSQSYQGTVSETADNLIAYYKFEGSGSSAFPVEDKVGSNDLRIARGFPRVAEIRIVSSSGVTMAKSEGSQLFAYSASSATQEFVSGSDSTIVSSSLTDIVIASGSVETIVTSSMTVSSESVEKVITTNTSSLDFSGTNDYISYGSGSDTAFITTAMDGSGQGFAISFWVESIETEQEAILGSINNGTNNTALLLQVNTNEVGSAEANNFRLFVRDEDGSSWGSAMTSPPVTMNARWHHIVASYEGGSQVRWFVDGVEYADSISFGSTPTNIAQFNNDFVFGAYNNQGTISTYFNGALDEFTFHSKALSLEEVQLYYGSQKWLFESSVQLRSSFDGGVAGVTASVITDTSGNNRDGTPFGDIEYISNIPYYGTGSFEFPSHSLDSYITAPSVDAGHGDYTYEIWAKTDKAPASFPCTLISERLTSIGGTEATASFEIRMNTSGQYEHFVRDDTGTEYSASTTNAYDNDNWHRVVARRSGSDISITVLAQGTDAIDQHVSQTASTNAVTTGSTQLIMGLFDNGIVKGQFDGWMDDPRIWNYSRTDAELTGSSSQTLSGSEAGLLWYSTFNEPNSVVDQVSGSNGTLNYVRGSNRSPY